MEIEQSNSVGMIKSVHSYLTLIKFSHTIFALPFALLAMILAFRKISVVSLQTLPVMTIVWIVLAMVGARSGAMGFNRLIDRKWDALNPRTANRPSATGEISPTQMILMIILSFALLIYAAWELNMTAFYLSPVAIFLVCFYSYSKRFTSYSHFFLGVAIGAAPVAAWIAVTGQISPTSLILGGSVFTWIAGFDILYALQDLDFDKKTGLNSIPVHFGVKNSLMIARALHLITAILWIWLADVESLNYIFYIGVAISCVLLFLEHKLLKPNNLSGINIAFFNINAIISIILFISMTGDILLLPN